jgi:hypothetical protein
LEGTYVGHDYKYLEDIILSWHEDTVPIFIKALPRHMMPNLELRIRKFVPSKSFEPTSRKSTFDDRFGWIKCPSVQTAPFAIPYTQYVECGRLEWWARESYRYKLLGARNKPGRSLLSTVGLQDVLNNVSLIPHQRLHISYSYVLSSTALQHRLIKSSFIFAALTWVSCSALAASSQPVQDNHPEQITYTELSRSQESPAVRLRFATDEVDGISSCPTAIHCQLSLLCYERAKELEHDILLDLQKLLCDPSAKESRLRTIFIIYISLTLLMDAYESYEILFLVESPRLCYPSY